MKVFKNGLLTGLLLQIAIGPVFFYILNISLRGTLLDGLAAALAVTIVDYLYITLAIVGVGKFLENKKKAKVLNVLSTLVLVALGIIMFNKSFDSSFAISQTSQSSNIIGSFVATFILTISSPLTIVFWTSLFTSKAVEYNYTKRELAIFGLSAGLATLLFMSAAVIILSLLKTSIPFIVVQVLNVIVSVILITYGLIRFHKS